MRNSIILTVLLLSSLTSCTTQNNTVNDNIEPATAIDEIYKKETTLKSNLLFLEPYPDSDSLSIDIFDAALQLYANFNGLVDVKTDLGDAATSFFEETDDFTVCCKLVIDERYPTYQSFVEEPRNHFSNEIVEELLDSGYYFEKDDKFYSSAGDRGRNIKFHDVKYEIDSQTALKVIFKATVRYYKDAYPFLNMPTPQTEEEWAKIEFETKEIFYTYEEINNRWVFTTFELFY